MKKLRCARSCSRRWELREQPKEPGWETSQSPDHENAPPVARRHGRCLRGTIAVELGAFARHEEGKI